MFHYQEWCFTTNILWLAFELCLVVIRPMAHPEVCTLFHSCVAGSSGKSFIVAQCDVHRLCPASRYLMAASCPALSAICKAVLPSSKQLRFAEWNIALFRFFNAFGKLIQTFWDLLIPWEQQKTDGTRKDNRGILCSGYIIVIIMYCVVIHRCPHIASHFQLRLGQELHISLVVFKQLSKHLDVSVECCLVQHAVLAHLETHRDENGDANPWLGVCIHIQSYLYIYIYLWV